MSESDTPGDPKTSDGNGKRPRKPRSRGDLML
jgi:hypothetical protein